MAAYRPSSDEARTARSISSASGESSSQRGAAIPIDYPDLGSRVYLGDVPDSLTDALAELYSSFYCLIDYFELYDRPTNLNACILDDPRHVVLFTRRGPDAVILNQLFDIDRAATYRVCRSILRAMPKVRRVQIRGFKIDPADTGLPFRTLWRDTDVVMPLPSSLEDYERQLGRSTRTHLHRYVNGLSKAAPGFTFEVSERSAISDELIRRIVEFNHARMRVKGKTSSIDKPHVQRLKEMLAGYGFAGVLRVNEEIIAGVLCTKVGSSYHAHVQGFQYDETYAKLHIGLLCTYLTVCAAIEHGGLQFDFGWGVTEYKTHLGGRPLTVYNASLHRSRLSRAVAASEIRWLAARRVSKWRAYRRLRHPLSTLRRVARRTGERSPR